MRRNHGAIIGIGGSKQSVRSAIVKIPFQDMGMVIEVNFSLLSDCVPSIIPMKYIIDNNLELSVQNQSIVYATIVHPIIMRNYLLMHR